jgi:SAM-dependent methyltransferase
MASSTTIADEPLPQQMQEHTYSIMRRVEDGHWWFVGRRRIIESFLQEICANLETDRPRILDVGCGTGANLEMLKRFGTAQGVDVSAEALAFCRERGLEDVRLGEAERLPFDDRSFDLVTALDVLEHLDDDVAGLREMGRILSPGGRILLFVPAFMFLWGPQDDVSHHRRRYTLPGLRQVVRKSGLVIERATYANITLFAPILLGRVFMRVAGLRPASENNINVGPLNGLLGRILGSEGAVLNKTNLPFGVSAICIVRH